MNMPHVFSKGSVLGLALAVGLGAANSVNAVVDCFGSVTNLSLQLSTYGTVTLSLSGGPSYTYLCNIDGSVMNGVSNKVCSTMYNTLLTAKAMNKKVTIRFYDHATCAAVPSWANAGSLGWTILHCKFFIT